MAAPVTPRGGLEGITAGRSALCEINGVTGKLLYCGYDVVDLAARSSFEETAYLLWHGELPLEDELTAMREQVAADLDLEPSVWAIAQRAPDHADPMDVLRTQVSLLGMVDPDTADRSDCGNRAKAARLVAQVGTLVATSERIRQRREPLPPRPGLSLAGNFLYQLRGEEATAEETRIFDICLILHAEHGMNASTFAARVTASTLADMHAAACAAIAALKGELHGRANERVMDMLRTLPDVESVPSAVRDMLAGRRRIMGFGHRVYRTEDPRATILRGYSKALGERMGDRHWYELTRRLETTVLEEKGLYPNVDLYSASVYTSLQIPQRLFTAIFAVSRMAGWTANIMEQHRDNRLIRPDCDYIGPPPRPYTPMDHRVTRPV
ncbi:MAG: citrate/2-methylcitrate synthase [Candidatus Dormibacteria bacterium]